MRKLSKKISMLMVLAMLVSLFSGVVSASAASKWSFYDREAKEVVAKGDTYEMEKNQYANFDLYCEGEEADADTYSYYWESSDPEVVYVDKTNGRLRADKYGKAEAGDKAVISVYIDNKTTAKNENAKRSFTIEIVDDAAEAEYAIVADFADEVFAVGQEYDLAAVVTADGKEIEAEVAITVDGKALEGKFVPAKAADYTVVVTATVDGEVVAAEDYVITAEEFNDFAIEQASMKTFTMTFAEGKDLSKVTKDDVIVMQAASLDGVQIKQFVQKVEAKDNVLTVTLYNEMSKDSYVFAKFAGEEEAFQVVKGGVTAVEIIPAKVEIGKVTKLNIKLYDEFGIDITTDAELAKVTVEEVAGGENANIENGRYILFWNDGKATTVKATYHTYTYKDGKEVTYVSNEAEITSVKDATSYSGVTEWVVTTETNKDKIKWNGNNRVALGDTGYYAIGKIIKTSGAVTTKDETIITVGQGLTFESSDNTVVIAMADGQLLPVGKGSADIIVKQNNEIKGVCTVVVVDARKAATMSLTSSKNVISMNDSIEVKLDVKDQYGDSFNALAAKIEVKDLTTNATAGSIAIADNKVTFNGNVSDGSATKSFYRSIKVGDAIAYFEFTVKKIEGDAVTFAFDADSIELDATLASNTGKNFAELYGAKTIAVKGYDKNGLLTTTTANVLDIKDTSAVSKAVTGLVKDGFYVTISAPNNDAKAWVAANVGLDTGKVSFTFVKDGAKLTQAPAGTYVINLYKAVESYKDGGTQYYVYNFCDSVPVTVKKNQKAYAVEVKSINTDELASEVIAVSGGVVVLQNAIQDVFKITYDNNEIVYTGISADASADYVTGYGKTIIFKKVKIDTTFSFLDGTKTLEETITFPTISVTGK